jgi:hypothetical protein
LLVLLSVPLTLSGQSNNMSFAYDVALLDLERGNPAACGRML